MDKPCDNKKVQQFTRQENNSTYQCQECGLYLDSEGSLDVHLRFTHNRSNPRAAQTASSHGEETNNNTTKANAMVKREFVISNTSVMATTERSDSFSKKSPDYSRTTPENMFSHAPTSQSYQRASPPYQNPENNTFTPSFQNFQHVKCERLSPPSNHLYNNYPSFSDQFYSSTTIDSSLSHQNYNQDYAVHKNSVSNSPYRFHPYQQTQHRSFEHPQLQSQASSSSPVCTPQPTPSPSPKTCDTCGYVCDSDSRLIEHLNIAHPPTPPQHLSAFQSNQFMFGNENPQLGVRIKLEDESQSEILDLDSHKVHQVFPEDDKRQNVDHNIHNSRVPALIGNWSSQQQQSVQNQQNIHQGQRLFINSEQKMFNPNIPSNIQDQKMFQTHQMANQEFITNGVSTSQESLSPPIQNYSRPFEHLPAQPTTTAVISSSQVPNSSAQTATPPTKSASWKSNEARRPKTYNCTACNKWFTSSGHLKRHYNTTLHKNAVKASGLPDPALLPISTHHHPARDNSSREDRTSNSPGDDSRGDDVSNLPSQFERPTPIPTHLQQPPSGPYDRQPAPNILQPPLHSPMPAANPMISLNNLASSNGNSPNGEAGPSTVNLDSRGLLSLSANHNTSPGFNMAHPMMSMESNQFQMYPNGSAPHVMQDMATSSLNTTGELQFITDNSTADVQALPSFDQIHAHRFNLMSYENANVGGEGSATGPYTFYSDSSFENIEPRILYKAYSIDNGQLSLITDQLIEYENESVPLPFPPSPHLYSSVQHDFQNNNISVVDSKMQMLSVKVDTEPDSQSSENLHIKPDYEENPGNSQVTSTTQPRTSKHACYDCQKFFNKPCYLTQHNKTFHAGDKPFKCTRCGKRFADEAGYEEHAAKHAGDKPYKCDQCPKQFNHKTDLRRHMCLHTGKKPFSCHTCGKGFIRKDHMLKHCETHKRKALSKGAGGSR